MKKLTLLFLTILSLTFFSFKGKPERRLINVIPRPRHVLVYPGNFRLKENTRIVVTPSDKLKFESQYLANIIKNHTDFHPEIIAVTEKEPLKNVIILRLDPKASDNQEGYQLKVNKKTLSFQRQLPKGFFTEYKRFYSCYLLLFTLLFIKKIGKSRNVPFRMRHDFLIGVCNWM